MSICRAKGINKRQTANLQYKRNQDYLVAADAGAKAKLVTAQSLCTHYKAFSIL